MGMNHPPRTMMMIRRQPAMAIQIYRKYKNLQLQTNMMMIYLMFAAAATLLRYTYKLKKKKLTENQPGQRNKQRKIYTRHMETNVFHLIVNDGHREPPF